MHRLADDEAIVDESISDVAHQWDERCKSALSQGSQGSQGRVESEERSAVSGRRSTVKEGDDTQSKKVHPKRIPQMLKPLSR